MIQDAPVKLNPVSHIKSSIPKEEDSFHQQVGLKFQEETSKAVHFVHRLLWCWNVGT
jgi:hypothetical protein